MGRRIKKDRADLDDTVNLHERMDIYRALQPAIAEHTLLSMYVLNSP